MITYTLQFCKVIIFYIKSYKSVISKSLYAIKMITLNYSFCSHKQNLKRLEHQREEKAIKKKKFKILIDKHKNIMLWCIIEYVYMKTALPPATLYAYITEYEKSLKGLVNNWLTVDNDKVVTDICDVPITTLETLPLNEARLFQRHLQGEGI